jgi:hypothetical protein
VIIIDEGGSGDGGEDDQITKDFPSIDGKSFVADNLIIERC